MTNIFAFTFTVNRNQQQHTAHSSLEHKLSDSQSDANSTKIMFGTLYNNDHNSNDEDDDDVIFTEVLFFARN